MAVQAPPTSPRPPRPLEGPCPSPSPVAGITLLGQCLDKLPGDYVDAQADGPSFKHLRDGPAERFLLAFDANGDGIVDESEVPEHSLEYFYGYDVDGDGLLTPDDLPED